MVFSVSFRETLGYTMTVKVIRQDIIEDFKKKHADARSSLDRWIHITEASDWQSFAGLRQSFGSADLVKEDEIDYTVFNIGGNRYRLVTKISYLGAVVVVAIVMTHAEYSKGRWQGK